MKKSIVGCVLLVGFIGGCSSTPENAIPAPGTKVAIGGIPGAPKPGINLVPRARAYTGEISPVIRHLLPKSVSETYGFRPGDQILKLNGENILTAAQFEQKIKAAPTTSSIMFRRGGKVLTTNIKLGIERPRFGAGFEPEGVALFRRTSPLISFMHKSDVTAFTETSVTEDRKILRMNVILNSTKIVLGAKVKFSAYDRGQRKSLGSGTEIVDALSPNSKVLKMAFKKNGQIKGPISVALDVEGKQFRFEFQ